MAELFLDPEERQILYGPMDLVRLLGLSRPMIDQEIKLKRLKALRFGKRILVRHEDLMEWIDTLPDYEMPVGGRTRLTRHIQAEVG